MDKETFKRAERLNATITKLESIKDRFEIHNKVDFVWEGVNSNFNSVFCPVPEEFNEMIYNVLMIELEKAKQEFKEL